MGGHFQIRNPADVSKKGALLFSKRISGNKFVEQNRNILIGFKRSRNLANLLRVTFRLFNLFSQP